MNQLKEYLIWIVLGIPGMVLIGLVLHSLVHFETGVLMQVGARCQSAFRDEKGCNEIKF